jgi:hypothetical protein
MAEFSPYEPRACSGCLLWEITEIGLELRAAFFLADFFLTAFLLAGARFLATAFFLAVFLGIFFGSAAIQGKANQSTPRGKQIDGNERKILE